MKRFRALALILLLAGVLQFADLGSKSLWIDEVASVRIAARNDFGDFFDAFERSERQPPVHHLLLHWWVKVAGESDAAVRVPSAIFAVGSVALAFWLGRLLAGVRVGLISAYLFAVSPFLLLYGRMARYFAPALFFSMLSTIALVLAVRLGLQGRRTGRAWLAYVAATVAMLMTSYPTVAIFLSQAAFMVLWLRGPPVSRIRAQWLASQAAVLSLFGVWVIVEWQRLVTFGRDTGQFQIKGIKGVVLDVVYPFYSFGLGETIFPWHPAAIVGVTVIAVAAVVGTRQLRTLELGWFPLILFAGAYLITVAAFQFFTKDLPFSTLPSRAIGAFPFYILIVALGISALDRRLRVTALVALTVAASFAGWNYFTGKQFHQPTYAIPKREIVESILARALPTDLIVSDSDLDIDHYYRPSGRAPDLFEIRQPRSDLGALQKQGRERIWLITQGRDRTRGRRPVEIEAWLEANFRQAEFLGFIPQNPFYSRIKEWVQGFEDYRYKATVRLFER